MNQRLNILLAVIVLCLLALCYMSVCAPLRFDAQREQREQSVKERLVQIRQAEEAYRRANGAYAGDFSELVSAGLLADSLQYVPHGHGQRFVLSATMQTGKSGQPLPLMECAAPYESFLGDLDARAVAALVEEAQKAGRYAGLKIGDLLMPNNNAGNWE